MRARRWDSLGTLGLVLLFFLAGGSSTTSNLGLELVMVSFDARPTFATITTVIALAAVVAAPYAAFGQPARIASRRPLI